jgi:hypothetical protein
MIVPSSSCRARKRSFFENLDRFVRPLDRAYVPWRWHLVRRFWLCARAAYRSSQYVREVMLALLLAFTGFAFLDSLNPMTAGITTAVVYDSLLRRRSPIPGGLSFVAGVFALNITFGVCTVLGLKILTNLVHFALTPTIRYWAELAVGLVLVSLASLPAVARPASPTWAAATMIRRRPSLLGFFGIAIGLSRRRPHSYT